MVAKLTSALWPLPCNTRVAGNSNDRLTSKACHPKCILWSMFLLSSVVAVVRQVLARYMDDTDMHDGAMPCWASDTKSTWYTYLLLFYHFSITTACCFEYGWCHEWQEAIQRNVVTGRLYLWYCYSIWWWWLWFYDDVGKCQTKEYSSADIRRMSAQ
jgi:hypothetical protein